MREQSCAATSTSNPSTNCGPATSLRQQDVSPASAPACTGLRYVTASRNKLSSGCQPQRNIVTSSIPTVLALALGCSAFVLGQSPQDPTKTGHDAYAGMDPDGRIPKPQLPEDLQNPSRWRYTPPGRIPPGGLLDRFLVSNFIAPVFFREDDIGFGGGFALTDIDFRNQRYREFANVIITYSAEGQQTYRAYWARWLHHRELPNGGIVREERGRIYGRARYEKTLTRRFFGFGSRTSLDDETSFTHEVSRTGMGLRDCLFEPGGDWLYEVEGTVTHHGLSAGRISSVPSTDQVYPELTAKGDGVDELVVNLSLGHDTRDSLHQPYSGHRVGLSASNSLWSGGEIGSICTLEARYYLELPPLLHGGGQGNEENPPTDTLALGAFVQEAMGEMPFYRLPSLGGADTLRAFVPNRFTDQAALHAAMEYRLSLVPRGFGINSSARIERLGLALFHEWGTVAPGIDALDEQRFHHSTGFGLRIAFAREATFRLDFGYGTEGSNFTLAFGSSF
jgi:hypothetical protein